MSEVVETVETTEAPAPLSMEEAAKVVFADATPAAPAPVEEPAKEPVAEVKEEPVPDERVAKRIAAAKRAEIAAAKQRTELRTMQEQVEREKAELETTKARYKLLEEDPVKAFEVLKLDPKTFLEKLSGEYKPENVAERQLKALQEEVERLKAERTKDIETAKERAAREQSETSWRQAATGFVTYIESTADKYPHLVAEFTESEALDAAYRALHEVVGHDDRGQPITRNDAYRDQFGKYPDDDVIAEYLDAQAKARAEARQNSTWRKQVSAPGSQPLSNGDPNPKAPPVNKGSSPRTLTSRAASEKATSVSKQWSQEAADEESIRILEAALRKMG